MSIRKSPDCFKKLERFNKCLFILCWCCSLLITPNLFGQDGGEIPTEEARIQEGQTLFDNNCTVCHAIDRDVVGPALQNVHERRELSWLKDFITNSQQLIQSGDETAVELYNEYNKTVMPAFDFSDEEVASIIGYIKQQSEQAAQAEGGGAEGQAQEGAPAAQAQEGGGVSSGYLKAILIGLVVVLLLILIVLWLIVTVLTKFLREREDLEEDDKEIVNQKIEMGKVFKAKPFIAVVFFIFVAIVTKSVVDGLYSVGIQQGYQPKQPIAFSHKLHAGQFEIDCQYCHTGVMEAKNANIPSPNICMNCHTDILTESPEIKKIYAAIDYDPNTRTYGNDTHPIEWVRVHNLPDLAYFNHAQHVNVGEVECQTCHGEIQEMEVVRQENTLTMGWCINCHRETEIQAEGNEYYDKLVEYHNENGDGGPLVVEDIGGLECSKCHY